MKIFTNTNYIENIFMDSEIMKSEEILDLYIIDKDQIDILKILTKLGPILYRTKYHLITMFTDLDIVDYINNFNHSEKSFYFFEEQILKNIKLINDTENLEATENINIINNNNTSCENNHINLEVNFEKETKNKRKKNSFKEEGKKDLRDGLSITAVMKKYNCSKGTIYNWKRELDLEANDKKIKEQEKQEREKIIQGLMVTSPKFEIDRNKIFSEDDGTFYYIDYEWHIKVKEYFDQVGLQIDNSKIWVIEKIFEEYLEVLVDSKVFEAVLRANNICYSPGIMKKLYEIYSEIYNEYKTKNDMEHLYNTLYA